MQFYLIILFLGFCFLAPLTYAASTLNLPYGVSPISHQIYDLHMAAFYVCCGIGAIVFGVLIYSLIKFRKSKGAKPAHFHEHLGIEIIWTTIPFIILIILAIPATIVLQNIHNTDASSLSIKIIGYQWRWKYEYLDQGISYFSSLSTPQDQINNKAPKDRWFLLEVDNPVIVPVNTKVKLLITSNDVIHAWWVPELGVKQDAIPGYINENWIYITTPGTYRGQCGELCGVNHGFMPIVVKAVSQTAFNKWVEEQHQPAAKTKQTQLAALNENELLNLGKTNYEKTCAMCHQNNGSGLPPNFPSLKHSPIVTGPLKENILFVLKGVPGTAMQAYAGQLDNTALAGIITYIRHAWGNGETNQLSNHIITAQPKDIEKARQVQ